MTDIRDASRRAFLRGSVGAGLAAGSAALAGAARAEDPLITDIDQQPWTQFLGDGVDAAPYGVPSEFEAHVVRRNVPWLTADVQSSVNFTPLHELEGIITPNGLCFERHHGGVAVIPPGDWRLMVNGLVERPMVFTLEDVMRFPRVTRAHFLECAANSGMEWKGAQLNGCQYTHGMIHNVVYSGVALKHILAEAGLRPSAAWVLAEGADSAAMTRSIPLEKILDDCLLATHMNGERLRPEQGYPARLVVPGWEGNMWVKWIRRLEIGDQPWHHREETSKYTDLMPDGRARRFTWTMDVKSVITNPSPQAPIRHGRGPLNISGIAWSGHGRVREVHVSTDGGVNWRPARLDGPSLAKSMHRFYFEHDWDGAPMLLQSRAIDEAGNVQPTKAALRKVRGGNSIYHNNGIQTWAVDSDGVAENVEIS
jgi:sulfane dehydrogenase subunit SoxC